MIDTHIHVIEPEQLSYGWLGEIDLARSGGFEQYRQAAIACGIKTAIHVEADVAPGQELRETAVVRDIVRDTLVGGIIANLRPGSKPFRRNLEELLTEDCPSAPLCGIRQVLFGVSADVANDEPFLADLRLLALHGLTFDLCVDWTQIPLALAITERCPELNFVLDHLGCPDLAPENFRAWAQGMERLSGRPRVWAKISGLAGAPSTVAPYIQHAVQLFGWDRVVWGSNWPVAGPAADVAHWVSATRFALTAASDAQLDQLFVTNASRLWPMLRLEKPLVPG